MANKKLIRINNLTKIFDEDNRKEIVLDNFSCDINEGELLFITGPNGIGKTTAIRILSGKINANLGKINEIVELNEILEYY